MPSYRVTFTIGRLAPGVHPERVLPTASEAAAELAQVESADLTVVAGYPRITVRFAADDDESAAGVASRTFDATSKVAELLAPGLTLRVGGRWIAVR